MRINMRWGISGISFLLLSSSAFATCTKPTVEATYTTCPVSGVTEISIQMAPFCASGGGTAATDDTIPIQNALNAGLACRLPVLIPTGYYYVSKSLYLYGHGGTSTMWQTGGQLRGAGLYSEIVGDLTEAYPVLDATGYSYGRIQDLTIAASGEATAAILLGASGTSGTQGDSISMQRVSASGGTIAGVVDLGSDLLTVTDGDFSGPYGLVVSAQNIVGIDSKFNTLVANGTGAYANATLARVYDSVIQGTVGSAIWVDGMDTFTLMSTYIHLAGTANSGIRVTAQKSGTSYVSRADSLYLYNPRMESSSTASPTYFVDLQPGVNTQHGAITGTATGYNGANIHLPVGASMMGYDLNFTTNNTYPVIDGDIVSGVHQVGALSNTHINAPGSMGYLGTGSYANTLIAFYGQTWSTPANGFNYIVKENTTSFTAPLSVTGEISPSASNTYSLGDSTHLFTAVYAKNGTVQTSDARQKKNIVNSDLGLEFINNLRPVSFQWKSGPDNDRHYGLIAQETEKAINSSISKSGRKPASDEQIIVSHDPKTGDYGLKYSELISPTIRAVQELSKENSAMKSYICGKDPTASFCKP